MSKMSHAPFECASNHDFFCNDALRAPTSTLVFWVAFKAVESPDVTGTLLTLPPSAVDDCGSSKAVITRGPFPTLEEAYDCVRQRVEATPYLKKISRVRTLASLRESSASSATMYDDGETTRAEAAPPLGGGGFESLERQVPVATVTCAPRPRADGIKRSVQQYAFFIVQSLQT